MRINKYVSMCGLGSRREADRLVEAGRVSINGQVAESGMQVEEGDTVCVDGKPITPPAEKTYLKLYKPVGIVCTADPTEKNNVIDYVHAQARVTYAGRLDRNSEGLLLLTDDGDLIDALMRSKSAHEKEYEVTLSRVMRKEEIERMTAGVYLEELERTTLPCRIDFLGSTTYRFVLTQGLNRQIRRMAETFGLRVRKLKRVRVATLELGDLKKGEWRPLTEEEVRALKEATEQKG